jgi:hypothetical protein
VRVWDVRRLSDKAGPLAALDGVPATHPTANVAWSPDGRLLLAGTAARRGQGDGRVLVWELAALEARYGGGGGGGGGGSEADDAAPRALDGAASAVYSAAVCPGASVVVLAWHPRINQLAAGCGDGVTRVLYDPSLSTKGALLSTARGTARRARGADDTVSVSAAGMDVLLPNALPMYRDPRLPKKRRFEEPGAAAGAPRKQPSIPADQPEFLTKGTRTFTQYYMQNVGIAGRTNIRTQDPTEVLRGYADKAAAERGAVLGALATGPAAAPVLAAKTLEQEEEEQREEVQRLLGAKGAVEPGKKR